jgi:hypothetical protein
LKWSGADKTHNATSSAHPPFFEVLVQFQNSTRGIPKSPQCRQWLTSRKSFGHTFGARLAQVTGMTEQNKAWLRVLEDPHQLYQPALRLIHTGKESASF